VVRSLEQIIEWCGKLDMLRCDTEPEYISGTLFCWAEKQGIEVKFIQPRKP
jgi:putative transposase